VHIIAVLTAKLISHHAISFLLFDSSDRCHSYSNKRDLVHGFPALLNRLRLSEREKRS